jgi:hypothetical protein
MQASTDRTFDLRFLQGIQAGATARRLEDFVSMGISASLIVLSANRFCGCLGDIFNVFGLNSVDTFAEMEAHRVCRSQICHGQWLSNMHRPIVADVIDRARVMMRELACRDVITFCLDCSTYCAN